MVSNQERRHFRRFDFEADAFLIWNEKRYVCELVDISLKGLLLSSPDGWTANIDDVGEIELRLADQSPIRMHVRVAHLQPDRAGFRQGIGRLGSRTASWAVLDQRRQSHRRHGRPFFGGGG